jgi:hypothetical protein|tara:strand:+ start:509 stop:721 length:213 start_codon:yes stop_codon:yes gene_type:complete
MLKNSYNPKGFKTYTISHNNGSDNAPTLTSVTFRNSNQNLIDGKWCTTENFIESLAEKLNVDVNSIQLVS